MTDYKMPPNAFDTYDMRPRWMMYAGFSREKVAVYLALWSHFSPKKPFVHPGVERLVWLTGISENKVRAILLELQDDGLILIKPPKETGWRMNQYYLFTLSRAEIETLVSRRDPKLLTSTNEKTRRSDLTPSPGAGYPSPGAVYPSPGAGYPSPGVAEGTQRRNTKKEHKEGTPETPASGGGNPEPEALAGALRAQGQTTGFSGDLSSTNDSGTDFSSLRARLERHT